MTDTTSATPASGYQGWTGTDHEYIVARVQAAFDYIGVTGGDIGYWVAHVEEKPPWNGYWWDRIVWAPGPGQDARKSGGGGQSIMPGAIVNEGDDPLTNPNPWNGPHPVGTSGSGAGVGGGTATGPTGPTTGNPNGALLTPQLGLLEDDLAYRLSLLCVNVIQPLKDKYPNLVVLSGFRQTNNGIGQHELGEAVDLQIRNQTDALLYEVADYIQKFLNFDQLVLNFTNIGDGASWIHVSFSKDVLRGQVITKDFSDTFHDGLFLISPLSGEAAAQAARDQSALDANILKELQNIQTRQARLGQASSVIADASADVASDGTAAPTAEAGGTGASSVVASGGITFQGAGFGLDSVIGMSSPDVRDWAVTTHITALTFNPGNMHIEFDKQTAWGSVNIGGGTQQQATLWVFLFISGQWYCAAAERLRPSQQNKPEDPLYSNWIAVGWLFAARQAFFGPMTGYVPGIGEKVGFMVTQGSERLDSNWLVQERSDILWVQWPQDGKAVAFP